MVQGTMFTLAEVLAEDCRVRNTRKQEKYTQVMVQETMFTLAEVLGEDCRVRNTRKQVKYTQVQQEDKKGTN